MSDRPLLPDRPSRLRLTGFAALQAVSIVPLVVLFALWVVGGVLMIVWVGALLLAVAIPSTRWLANGHRRMAASVLGQTLPAPYVPLKGRPVLNRLRAVATDPMTWRDLGWMLVAMTLGFVVSLIVVALLLGVVTFWIWYYAVGPLMRLRAAADRWLLSPGVTERLERRVEQLTETRADAVDHSAAELRRLERDLHDGAQARLVALSLSLGMADEMFDRDPDGARRLVTDARETTDTALADLRSVVRGIHPPVLADRGLVGAVQALALDMAVPVRIDVSLEGRLSAPVESAVYFAVAECLANVGKHSGAENAWIRVEHADGVLRVEVGDDGRGGADPTSGTGMTGIMRRLRTFDGTMMVLSPVGGPTIVTLEVPCVLSSPRTTPSSAPASPSSSKATDSPSPQPSPTPQT
ncbi:sensor domain-containing protein [Nocardioides sp. HM23]|uniref:sensor histidine kinase n=1 Tax=Nocardioides bizhenqiangii TaxID=3095076 RepID=UPI002ACA24EB|nr:sensor domain-containing protein [Nocardioides sp. HM23]MDZ5620754.1 sensor domain-containing protein [Nocardioides sp. HM23]